MIEQDSQPGVDCLHDHCEVFTKTVVDIFLRESLCVSKERLETISTLSDGQHPALREGSHVYVAYSGQCPLYAGETGVTVRTRFTGHGNASHNRKPWYEEVSHVRFLPLSCDSDYYRKLVEAALIIELRPREQMRNA